MARPYMSSSMTNLFARSDTCLVSSVVDGYRPMGIHIDFGEVIFIDSWFQKVKADGSAYQIDERSEYLQRTERWINTAT